MVERAEGWRFSCEYSPDEYEPDTIGGLLQEFQGLLSEVAADPNRPISAFRSGESALRDPDDSSTEIGKPDLLIDSPIGRVAHPIAMIPAGLETSNTGRDDIEDRLVKVWSEVLRVEMVAVTDDFYDLGGHSLTAARLVVKIQDRFGVRLSPAVLLEHPTVRDLARVLKRATVRNAGSDASPSSLHTPLAHANGREFRNGKATHGLVTPNSSGESRRPASRARGGPFFFRSAEGQLFGVYSPPENRDRGEGVVICALPGHEYMTTHMCLRVLATELSRAGFHVLRFDYSCLGNSWGEFEEASASRWVRDIGAAIGELYVRSSSSTISLVGLRLGGALAYLAGHDPKVKHVLLWDPVSDGADYLTQLRRMQSRIRRKTRDSKRQKPEELLGYYYSSDLIAELERIDLAAAEPKSFRLSLVFSEDALCSTKFREQLALRLQSPTMEGASVRSGWEDDDFTRHRLLQMGRRLVLDLLGRTWA